MTEKQLMKPETSAIIELEGTLDAAWHVGKDFNFGDSKFHIIISVSDVDENKGMNAASYIYRMLDPDFVELYESRVIVTLDKVTRRK